MTGEFHIIWGVGPGGAYELTALLITRYSIIRVIREAKCVLFDTALHTCTLSDTCSLRGQQRWQSNTNLIFSADAKIELIVRLQGFHHI